MTTGNRITSFETVRDWATIMVEIDMLIADILVLYV